MNAQELSSYLADAPPSVVRLEIKKHFDSLSEKQQRYAHFISRYAHKSDIVQACSSNYIH
jgi:dipeptidyl-peptidase-3